MAGSRLGQAGDRVKGLGIPHYLVDYFVYSAKIVSLNTFIYRGIQSANVLMVGRLLD